MKKKLLLVVLAVLTLLVLAACSPTPADNNTDNPDEQNIQEEAITPSVMALKGPTGVAMAKMIDDNDANQKYQFSLVGSPDEIVSAISSGEADIAAMPTNLAVKLYAKNEGDLQMISVIADGSLYLLENGNTINSLADLEGKTIYATGQGSNPQYILEYLLKSAGLTPGENVEVVYKTEHAELATLMAAGDVDIAMLPEPNVSVVLSKNDQVRVALDFNEEWNAVTGGNLTMSCVAATKTFIAEHPQAVADFLADLQQSITFALDDVEATAALCAEHGIIENEAVGAISIPKMGLTYVDGADIEPAVSGYLTMLFEADPSSVGGAMPAEDFYYLK